MLSLHPPRRIRLPATAALGIAMLLHSGCGSEQVESRRTAQDAFDAGVAAFEAEDYAQAEAEFGEALQGELLPDLRVDGYLQRARALAHLGQYDEGLAEIDKAEGGPMGDDQLWLARSDVHQLKGDLPAARDAFQQARELNPGLKMPDELK